MPHSRPTTPTVEAISRLKITGNVVPRAWLQRLKMPTGAPDPVGALVLAEVIFWYRWSEVVDPATQLIVAYERKFKADKLQKSHQQLAHALGFSKQQVRDALERLERGGYITKEVRHFPTKDGIHLSNVLFLEPVPAAIDALTFTPVEPSATTTADDAEPEEPAAPHAAEFPYGPQTTPYGPQTTPSPPTDHTYTQNTTQITTKDHLTNEVIKPAGAPLEVNTWERDGGIVVTHAFQDQARRIGDRLGAPRYTTTSILKACKEEPQLADAAFRYAVDYPEARNRVSLFFYKLQALKLARRMTLGASGASWPGRP